MDLMEVKSSNGLGELMSHIIINYLAKLYCICVVWKSADIDQISNIIIPINDANEKWKFNNNLMTTMTMDRYNHYQLVWLEYKNNSTNNANIDDIIESGINTGCQAFIVTSSVTFDFLNAYEAVRYTAENRYHLMHFVFLQTSAQPTIELNQRYQQILNHSTIYDVANILIIGPSINNNDAGNKFDLITTKFVSRFNNTDAVILDTFFGENGTFQQNANLFPDKFTNLYGRIVRLALFNYKPYAIWKEVPSGLGNANQLHSMQERTLFVDGTESLMFIEFCLKHNCTLEISLDEAGEWGQIFDNFSGDGVIGAVAERRADVGFTALYLWAHEFQFLDFTAAITRSGITCLVPKPRLLGGWLLPAMPFSKLMWFGVLISFISLIIGASIINYFIVRYFINADETQKHQEPIPLASITLKIWATFLLQSTNIMTRNISEMILFGCILLVVILIGTSYGGGLASIMTIPHYEAPIDTVHQLAAANMEWGATHDAWIFSILYATQPDVKKLVSLFRPMPTEELAKRTTTQDFSFSIERLPYGHYAVGEYIDEKALNYLQLMPNDIYYEYCVGMSYKTWPFKSSVDLLILQVAQTGIQKYWELQTVIKYNNNKIQLGISISRHRENQGPIRLTPFHVSGAFILWTIGIGLSIVVFLIEILISKKSKQIEIFYFAHTDQQHP